MCGCRAFFVCSSCCRLRCACSGSTAVGGDLKSGEAGTLVGEAAPIAEEASRDADLLARAHVSPWPAQDCRLGAAGIANCPPQLSREVRRLSAAKPSGARDCCCTERCSDCLVGSLLRLFSDVSAGPCGPSMCCQRVVSPAGHATLLTGMPSLVLVPKLLFWPVAASVGMLADTCTANHSPSNKMP